MLEWVAQRVRAVLVKSPTLEVLKTQLNEALQLALIEPALSNGLELQRSLPTSIVPCSYEIGGLLPHLFITSFFFCPLFLKNTLTVTF